MRRLTDQERSGLVEVGVPGEWLPDSVFEELEALGYGRWVLDPEWVREPDDDGPPGCLWTVTAKGREALRLDTIARNITL